MQRRARYSCRTGKARSHGCRGIAEPPCQAQGASQVPQDQATRPSQALGVFGRLSTIVTPRAPARMHIIPTQALGPSVRIRPSNAHCGLLKCWKQSRLSQLSLTNTDILIHELDLDHSSLCARTRRRFIGDMGQELDLTDPSNAVSSVSSLRDLFNPQTLSAVPGLTGFLDLAGSNPLSLSTARQLRLPSSASMATSPPLSRNDNSL